MGLCSSKYLHYLVSHSELQIIRKHRKQEVWAHLPSRQLDFHFGGANS